ncbi:AFG1 family ATPase [Thiohalocapsa marina]|uniref:AFG1 family ATPase n=1 Tax=Thiohalocapsa marina TaxID=424902 RepID=A0A5M8FRU0_9GAMM|nr:cell division protein ZapE [Thiohalocapsa marina]KAA6184172.1 AFG1 family ATPase [Thiohalocapsa marina]
MTSAVGPSAAIDPASAYQAAIADGAFQPDPAQAAAAQRLSRLYDALLKQPSASRATPGRLARLLRRRQADEPSGVRGLYLWGGVGRGKTWLMDLFVAALPSADRRRVHFHRFMQGVHADLNRLKGQPDPLRIIGAETASRCRVLCLDEMQVNDITDAMIMAGLLKALFDHGVTLVTTSNIPPDGLYRAGLQRDRFLPAIDLMQRHCEVLELASPTDYRLRQLEQASTYLSPLNDAAEQALARQFDALSTPRRRRGEPVTINDRAIPAVAWDDGVVWFDFDVICHIPRSKLDYVEVARCFHTLLLSHVRRLGDEHTNIAHRLISLIDAVYDCNVKLILSAEAPPETLYQGRDLAFEFQRTRSRLIEMQSRQYLARPHLA